jgi:hypothetical protein
LTPHQYKSVAPITYLDKSGKTVLVPDEDTLGEKPLMLSLKEFAILQTCVNRSYLNCNCNLNKDVLGSIVEKLKNNLPLYTTGD